MTTVEWLINELRKLGYLNSPTYNDSPTVKKLIRLSKDMEKEQMKKLYDKGRYGGQIMEHMEFEEYYEIIKNK